MASTCGPEIPVNPVSVALAFDEMGPQHLPISSKMEPATETKPQTEGGELSPRLAPPLPNPPFVFPAQPSSAPSSLSRATGSQSSTSLLLGDDELAVAPSKPERSSRAPPLPAFSFNPGASLGPEDSTPLSTPRTPLAPGSMPSPARPTRHGHRRGGSEFVGGSIRMGDSITVMSTSPTKSESGFASPGHMPPASRRLHMRNRSAIPTASSLVLKPSDGNSYLRGNASAPTSPANFDRDENASEEKARVLKPHDSEPSLRTSVEDPVPAAESSKTVESEPTEKPVPRARVGFSDTLEYIPRPLSLVSSDTSSTMTVRPSHSYSGSISSIVSTTASTAQERPPGPPPPKAGPGDLSDSRPSTAGAVLDRTLGFFDGDRNQSLPRRNSIPSLGLEADATVDAAEPSPSKTPKRWSFFGLEALSGSSSPTRSRPTSSSSAEWANNPASPGQPPAEQASEEAPTEDEHRPPAPRRVGKAAKKKKARAMKGWAGILSRKPKPRSHRANTGSRCPASHEHVEPEVEPEVEVQDPEIAAEQPSAPEVILTEPDAPAQDSDASSAANDDEPSYQMIDLDAALGPFNTPLPRNPEWEAAQNAAAQHTKRKLHSAQGMKGFSGPGMHYHRRTESAPEMVPFESRSGLHRLGSSSTMADVFEEDEEDDGSGVKSSSATQDEGSDAASSASDGDLTPSADVKPKTSVPEMSAPQIACPPSRDGAVSQDAQPDAITSIKPESSMASLPRDMAEDQCPVSFRTSSLFVDKHDGDCSVQRLSRTSRDLPPVEVSPLQIPPVSQAPVSPYSTSHASSFPSPRSPMSYDAQRISTAPSSVNDENNFQSLLLGEPGPEVRISVDDIPSLTSSNSTMTRESSFAQQAHLQQATASAERRPVSASSAAFGRRRSSLASLSRLISSSHGERSKLSMEISAETDAARPKTSRTKRLSRLVQFWKPKEEQSS